MPSLLTPPSGQLVKVSAPGGKVEETQIEASHADLKAIEAELESALRDYKGAHAQRFVRFIRW